jgi:hypothetical protein
MACYRSALPCIAIEELSETMIGGDSVVMRWEALCHSFRLILWIAYV